MKPRQQKLLYVMDAANNIVSAHPKGQMMTNLRKDAMEALLKANPLTPRSVVRKNAKILAKQWYRAIIQGKMPITSGGGQIQNGAETNPPVPVEVQPQSAGVAGGRGASQSIAPEGEESETAKVAASQGKEVSQGKSPEVVATRIIRPTAQELRAILK